MSPQGQGNYPVQPWCILPSIPEVMSALAVRDSQQYSLPLLACCMSPVFYCRDVRTVCSTQVEGVRVYHDQALNKEPGGGYTPWHCDGYYWPVQSDKIVTAWVPLQVIPNPLTSCNHSSIT